MGLLLTENGTEKKQVDIEHPLAFIFIQQQIFSVRKQSVSNKSFLCESEASVQKTSTFEDGEMNEDKASGGCHVQTLDAITPRRN
ncbi:hypothetical protein [Lysinibacillus xylanilyticus]|uniref:hypothetical protein n=1 Tax=Lysinibacillus xylanilyticus TaxID=582475 RepID=UPI0037FAF6DF